MSIVDDKIEDDKIKDLLNSRNWQGLFNERKLKEIEFSKLYAKDFAHGTDGHNAKLIIAKMAKMLDMLMGL